MYQNQFLKTEKRRRRKALAFTILFHVLLFGGLAFGTNMGEKITTNVKAWFQTEEPAVKASLVKNKK